MCDRADQIDSKTFQCSKERCVEKLNGKFKTFEAFSFLKCFIFGCFRAVFGQPQMRATVCALYFQLVDRKPITFISLECHVHGFHYERYL